MAAPDPFGTPDPYLVLGVPRSATPAEIARAYRARVRSHHPDTTGDTADADGTARHRLALEAVQAAYALLRDPALRAEYDHRHPETRAPAPAEQPRTVRVRVVRRPPPPEPPFRVGPVRWHR